MLHADPCPPKTRADLEWDRLLAALEARCASDLGRANARALPFASTLEEAAGWALEGRESLALLRAGEPLPTASMPDPTDTLESIAAGTQLGSSELRQMVAVLEAGRRLREFLEARHEACPTVAGSCATSPGLDAVSRAIATCFDPDGTVSDKASPGLRALRIEEKAQRARIQTKLEQFMANNAHFVQERWVTERDGHWVVPVKSTAVSRLRGTVHGESASGSTVFLEPDAIAGLTSKLRAVQRDVQREELAVFARLSALLCTHADAVAACAQAVARADLRAATAKLARDLRLEFPRLVSSPEIGLRGARHPLLVLELGDAVPSDVAANAGRCLVISGPNAGGKTVTLKTLGVAALMARAGLPLACDGDSTIGLFDVVLTELGDHQSLSKNLSTFSAHMTSMAGVLQRAAGGTLVLLDELASGTDPREGEALASGLLVALCEGGAAVAVTTHYEGLKSLALDRADRFVNASVGFDFASMRPTFRIETGVPGGSSAFAVAERFGIPPSVLETARTFLSPETVRFEQVVRRMNEERTVRTGVETTADNQPPLRTNRHDATSPPEGAVDAPTKGSPPAPTAASAETVRRGDRVFVTSLKRSAQVIEILDGDSVRVLAGSLKMLVAKTDLRPDHA